MNLTRSILRNRHRLSERQIDDFLGENSGLTNRDNRILEIQKIASFLEIAKLLKTNDIEWINLKGPLLSQRIYGDPTYRYSRDFDILVEPKNVNRVCQILADEDFEFPEFSWPGSKKKQEILIHFLNQIEMVHNTNGLMIEIHWKLFSARITDEYKLSRLIQKNVKTVPFGGVDVQQFSIEFELFYLIAHGGIHAWFRLKWLIDIHEILNRVSFNPSQFNHIISECNAQKLVGICNAMLEEYFPEGPTLPTSTPIPEKLAKISKSQCKKPEADLDSNRFLTLKLLHYRMKLFPSIQYKADVIKVLTFYKHDLNYKWLPTSKIACYIFRPFGFLFRRLKILD